MPSGREDGDNGLESPPPQAHCLQRQGCGRERTQQVQGHLREKRSWESQKLRWLKDGAGGEIPASAEGGWGGGRT